MIDQPARIRMTYAKIGNLRFIGHLDLQRLFERALRRTNLPLKYTQGFSPHLRVNLASALPLGFIGEAEQMDFWLEEPIPLSEIAERLRVSLPKELVLKDLQSIDNQKPSLQAALLSSAYEIVLPSDTNQTEIQTRISDLEAQPALPFQRRKKTVDLKDLIISWQLSERAGELILKIEMKSTPLENGRPDEFLSLLNIDPADCVIVRTKLTFLEE